MSNLFLNFEGGREPIKGESTRKKDAIEIYSYKWIEKNPSSGELQGQGQGSGKATWQDLEFSTTVSKASPSLFKACASGDHFTSVTLTCRKAGEDSGEKAEYFKIKFSKAMITHYQLDGADSDIPTESIHLKFSMMEMEYKEQKADGSLGGVIKKNWDINLNNSV